jgi:hypothetical protein
MADVTPRSRPASRCPAGTTCTCIRTRRSPPSTGPIIIRRSSRRTASGSDSRAHMAAPVSIDSCWPIFCRRPTASGGHSNIRFARGSGQSKPGFEAIRIARLPVRLCCTGAHAYKTTMSRNAFLFAAFRKECSDELGVDRAVGCRMSYANEFGTQFACDGFAPRFSGHVWHRRMQRGPRVIGTASTQLRLQLIRCRVEYLSG